MTKVNIGEYKENKQFELLDPGFYQVGVQDAEIKPNSKGTGTLLKVTLNVKIGDDWTNRKLWSYLNIKHDNEATRETGELQAWALCRAVEADIDTKGNFDTDDLMGKEFVVKVGIQEAKGQWKASNQVDEYYSLADGTKHLTPVQNDAPTDFA